MNILKIDFVIMLNVELFQDEKRLTRPDSQALRLPPKLSRPEASLRCLSVSVSHSNTRHLSSFNSYSYKELDLVKCQPSSLEPRELLAAWPGRRDHIYYIPDQAIHKLALKYESRKVELLQLPKNCL